MAYPSKLPKRYRWHWDNPHRYKARISPGFRLWLGQHGHLTPNFTKAEAACKDPNRTPIPRRLLPAARRHAFNLERLRHALGDKPIPIVSWYRTAEWNRAVGGASKSQHVNAIATDHPREWVERAGRAKVNELADRIWKDGGVGRYPAGAVHFDSRGVWARWTSF